MCVTTHLKRPTRILMRAAPVKAIASTKTLIWSCSKRGLPCHCCHQQCGALLPHLFTLTRPQVARRYIFCGTFRRLTPPRSYLALCPAEPGLSSRHQKLAVERLSNQPRTRIAELVMHCYKRYNRGSVPV